MDCHKISLSDKSSNIEIPENIRTLLWTHAKSGNFPLRFDFDVSISEFVQELKLMFEYHRRSVKDNKPTGSAAEDYEFEQ